MSKMIEMLIFSNFFSFFILYHLNLQLNFEARKKVAWHFTETFANAFVVCMGHIYTICTVPSERHEMKLKLALNHLCGRKLRQMTTGGSDEQWPETLTNGGRRFWRNGGLKFRRTRAGGSKEPRPDVPTNGGRRLQRTAVEDFEETSAWSSYERRPEAPMNGGRRFWRIGSRRFWRNGGWFRWM